MDNFRNNGVHFLIDFKLKLFITNDIVLQKLFTDSNSAVYMYSARNGYSNTLFVFSLILDIRNIHVLI